MFFNFSASGQFTCGCDGPGGINIDPQDYGSDDVVNLSELTSAGVLPANQLMNTCLAIRGQLIIDESYTIDGGEVKMQPGAEIVTGFKYLGLNNLSIHGCDITYPNAKMWRGIQVLSRNTAYIINVNNCIIQDAQIAFNIFPGAPNPVVFSSGDPTLNITDSELSNNYTGINITKELYIYNPISNPTLNLTNTDFIGSYNLLPPFDNLLDYGQSFAGIVTEKLFRLTISDTGVPEGGVQCSFSGFIYGILLNGRQAIIEGCKFEDSLHGINAPAWQSGLLKLWVKRSDFSNCFRSSIYAKDTELLVTESTFSNTSTLSNPVNPTAYDRGINGLNLIEADLQSNTFTNLINGIYLRESPGIILDNTFSGVHTAILFKKLLSHSASIRLNTITSIWNGIVLEESTEESAVDISGNNITLDSGGFFYNSAGTLIGGSGIHLSSPPTSLPVPPTVNRSISNNIVDAISGNSHNISVINAPAVTISGNTLTNSSSGGNITLGSSPNCTISENIITCFPSILAPNLFYRVHGILVSVNSWNTKVKCNTLTGYGETQTIPGTTLISFVTGDNSCIGSDCTEIKGNSLTYSPDPNNQTIFFNALKLNFTVTSPQIRTGNTWNGFTAEPANEEDDPDDSDDFIFGAFYNGDDFFQMFNSRFEVQTTAIPFHPQKIRNDAGTPDDWFPILGGNVYNCLDEMVPPGVTGIDDAIADYVSIHPGYTSIFHKGLYKKLSLHPELVNSGTLTTFMTTNQTTNIGKFHKIDADMSEAQKPTSAEKASLQSYFTERATIKADINSTELLMEQSSGSTLESLTETRDQLLTDLEANSDAILGIRATQKQRIINQASLSSQENNNIMAPDLFDQNQKDVNTILLDNIQNDTEFLSQAQETILQAIAIQCPQDGGGAVMQARQLLGVHVSDEACSAQSNFSIPENTTAEGQRQTKVFPNPANDKITIQLEEAIEGDLPVIHLYTAEGQLVFESVIPQTGNIGINVQNLPSGIYHYKIISDKKVIDFGKMVVAH